MATTTVLVTRGPVAGPPARDLIERQRGRLAQHGPGELTALFGSTLEAVEAAVRLHRLTGGNGLASGLHVGEVGPGGNYGVTLAAARDLALAGGPGRIIVSDLVHLLAPSVPVRPLPGESSGPVTAHEVVWSTEPEEAPIRTVIAEDAVLIRKGLERLLSDEGFEVVAGVGDYDALLAAVAAADPPVALVVTDIRMPPTLTDEGLRAAAVLRRDHPGLAIVVLSQHIEAAAAGTLLGTTPGSVAYLLKERVTEIDEFVVACRTVLAGGTVIDPMVLDQLGRAEPNRNRFELLSQREQEVLDQMAAGASNRAIGAALHCSEKTVESHVRAIFTKLDLPDHPDENRRVAAVVRWLSRPR